MAEEELIDRAARADIRVYGLSDYRIRENCEEKATILLGYANLTEDQIREAARLLRDCWIE